MKDIKFRCWVKKEKNMLYDWRATANPYFINGFMYRKSEIELMQYTGVKDINNKYVYEGDILEIWIDNIKQYNYYLVEDLKDLYLEMNRDDPYLRFTNIKVIGNKYENPELLLQ